MLNYEGADGPAKKGGGRVKEEERGKERGRIHVRERRKDTKNEEEWIRRRSNHETFRTLQERRQASEERESKGGEGVEGRRAERTAQDNKPTKTLWTSFEKKNAHTKSHRHIQPHTHTHTKSLATPVSSEMAPT